MIDGLVLFAVAFALVIGLSAFLALAYPTVNLDMAGWPAGAVAYVVTSAALLGWYGGWQSGVGATPGMLALKLRVRDPSGQANPSLRAAVIRNVPQVLVSFTDYSDNEGYSGNEGIDALLIIVTLVVNVAIGITISRSPTRQGFHDRLAGGTYVVRPAPRGRAGA